MEGGRILSKLNPLLKLGKRNSEKKRLINTSSTQERDNFYEGKRLRQKKDPSFSS